MNKICQASFMALSIISKIRNYVDQSQAEKLVSAFVTTHYWISVIACFMVNSLKLKLKNYNLV